MSMTAITKSEIKPTTAIHLVRHTRMHGHTQARVEDEIFSAHLPQCGLPQSAFYFTACFIITCVSCLSLPRSSRKLLEEAPLITKSLREAQMKEKMERYPKVSTSNRSIITILFLNVHVYMKYKDFE